jgi:hypothetical protein
LQGETQRSWFDVHVALLGGTPNSKGSLGLIHFWRWRLPSVSKKKRKKKKKKKSKGAEKRYDESSHHLRLTHVSFISLSLSWSVLNHSQPIMWETCSLTYMFVVDSSQLYYTILI